MIRPTPISARYAPGLPGVLPVLNKLKCEKAVLLAAAMHAESSPSPISTARITSIPDLPKGYQISQYDKPLARGRLSGSAHAGRI